MFPLAFRLFRRSYASGLHAEYSSHIYLWRCSRTTTPDLGSQQLQRRASFTSLEGSVVPTTSVRLRRHSPHNLHVVAQAQPPPWPYDCTPGCGRCARSARFAPSSSRGPSFPRSWPFPRGFSPPDWEGWAEGRVTGTSGGRGEGGSGEIERGTCRERWRVFPFMARLVLIVSTPSVYSGVSQMHCIAIK